MEEEIIEPASVKKVAMKWGLISAVIGIIVFIIGAMAEFQTNTAWQWGTSIITIVIIFLAHKDFKDSGDGYMSYGQGLGIGTLLSFISGLIGSIFAFAYISFVDTGYMEPVKEKQMQDMMDQGMPQAQIDQAMEMSSFFFSPVGILIMGIVGAVFIGFIISLIVSIFTKKNNPEFDI